MCHHLFAAFSRTVSEAVPSVRRNVDVNRTEDEDVGALARGPWSAGLFEGDIQQPTVGAIKRNPNLKSINKTNLRPQFINNNRNRGREREGAVIVLHISPKEWERAAAIEHATL
jgi:hypothetical protein